MSWLKQFFVVSNLQINATLKLALHWRHEKFNKWLGTYLSKYGMLINDQQILKYVLSK